MLTSLHVSKLSKKKKGKFNLETTIHAAIADLPETTGHPQGVITKAGNYLISQTCFGERADD